MHLRRVVKPLRRPSFKTTKHDISTIEELVDLVPREIDDVLDQTPRENLMVQVDAQVFWHLQLTCAHCQYLRVVLHLEQLGYQATTDAPRGANDYRTKSAPSW